MTIFSSLAPVFTIVSGWVFLSEQPNSIALLGIFVITVSVYSLFLKPKKNSTWLEIIKQPFADILNSRPTLFAFLSVIPPAISVVFAKKSVLDADAASYTLFFVLVIGLSSFFIELALKKRDGLVKQVRNLSKRYMVLSGFLLMLTSFTFSLATKYTLVANLIVLTRIGTVFQIVLAYYILREKTDLKRRLLISLFIIFGFCLTGLSKYLIH